MANQDPKALEGRIRELEAELKIKEQDLRLFRDEVAKLNEQLEKFITQLGQEIHLAHAIQKILVPTEIPSIPGFEFSTKYEASSISGGDYFDIFELEDKFRFGILLATSSGYGMSALFLSVLLKLSGHYEARKGKSSHETLALIAKEMVPNIPENEKSSVFYASVDRRVLELNYCQAGDLIGLYHRQSDGRLERLENLAPALHRDFNQPLESRKISLSPRDRIVLCSPGVLTVKNPKGESFEEERLYKIVLDQSKSSAHQLRNEIFFQVNQFAQGQEMTRDMTVIVIDVQDRVLKLAKS
ncbi:MAG TPA: SpoIIE family protein phosphatase, partial [Bdellovibrionales bacterium]|nr:SpoIIE family protein phosphatase [Bdellovibrionales bacterium]